MAKPLIVEETISIQQVKREEGMNPQGQIHYSYICCFISGRKNGGGGGVVNNNGCWEKHSFVNKVNDSL
jgi:hypothetical protein